LEEDAMTARLAKLAAALVLTLMSIGNVAQAQSWPPLDRNGRPYVTSNPQPSSGDFTRERPGPQPADPQAQAVSTSHGRVRHSLAFKDEYGFRYDTQGDRLDARGYVISPRTTTP
jgi:hypothetical protein